MLIHLHSQATTTPKVRAAIQASDEVRTVLAERFGDEADQKTIRGIVFLPNAQTICKWRKRDSVADRSHRPHRLQTTLTPAQEAVAVALRKTLLVSLDDLLALAIVLEPMAHKARCGSSWIRMSRARGSTAAFAGMAWVICAICRPRQRGPGTAASRVRA